LLQIPAFFKLEEPSQKTRPQECENTGFPVYKEVTHMDAEQINAIGSKLNDLAARTLDLRGYL
jgi:hypothetical protein